MTPPFRRAAPAKGGCPSLRKSALPLLLVCASTLAGCAGQTPPPDIDYDNAAPAVQASDPPAPVKVVELPIIFVDRKVGESKMSNDIVLEAMKNVWKLRFSSVPARRPA